MQDTTFEMEKRRNRPEKYNRELVHKTVKAMERISEVRVTPVCCNYVYPACKSRQMRGLQSEGFKGCAFLQGVFWRRCARRGKTGFTRHACARPSSSRCGLISVCLLHS